MDFIFCACPVNGCPNKALTYWYHHKCGSKTMIHYEDIQVFCSGCLAKGIIFDWKWSCKQHGFKPASKQGILFALGVLGQQNGNDEQIKKAVTKLVMEWPSD